MATTTESKPSGYVHRNNLDPEQEQLLELSDTLYAEKIVGQFSEFIKSPRPNKLPEVIIHRDAYSDKAEAQRDEFIRMLSNHLEMDVEAGLNKAEHDWNESEDKRVTLKPWMQVGLGMPAGQPPIECNGLSRDFDLMVKNGRKFAIHEIEFPIRRPNAGGVQGNLFARMIYFSALPVAE